jgi:hypothetical protein
VRPADPRERVRGPVDGGKRRQRDEQESGEAERRDEAPSHLPAAGLPAEDGVGDDGEQRQVVRIAGRGDCERVQQPSDERRSLHGAKEHQHRNEAEQKREAVHPRLLGVPHREGRDGEEERRQDTGGSAGEAPADQAADHHGEGDREEGGEPQPHARRPPEAHDRPEREVEEHAVVLVRKLADHRRERSTDEGERRELVVPEWLAAERRAREHEREDGRGARPRRERADAESRPSRVRGRRNRRSSLHRPSPGSPVGRRSPAI